MKIQSPRHGTFQKDIKALKESHGAKELDAETIKETNKESSTESEDESSSSGSDSSVDAMFEGEDNENALYKKVSETQERIFNGEGQEESKIDDQDLMGGLVDKQMVQLLRACSMLQRPSAEDIQKRKVKFGARTK